VPDWSYRTVLGRVLFSLPPERARSLAVDSLALLGGSAAGRTLIDLMGHMRPAARLATRAAGVSLAGPVGLGALVDPEGKACAALSRFGASFVELGPVAETAGGEAHWRRDLAASALHADDVPRVSLAQLVAQLARAPVRAAPIWVRIAASAHDLDRLVQTLHGQVAAFLVEATRETEPDALRARVAHVVGASRDAGAARLVLLSLPADAARAPELTRVALEAGARGVWLRGELHTAAAAHSFGAPARPALAASVRSVREACPEAMIVAGSVLEPADARALMQTGAQLVAVDAGLVLSGPGLIKRCNEALVLAQPGLPAPEGVSLSAARSAWLWAFLLGLSMLLGGAMALVIASTRVVLPYDEALCGMTRAQLMQVNPRLLPFMAHDRVTLAGSMLSIGTLYSALGFHALRRGAHWAHVTVVASALTGFFSIFLFLGFGYFDPFHAFVTTVLFQLLLMCVGGARPEAAPLEQPEWHETAAFRRGQWGQLIFVLLAVGLVLAGAVICFLGCTSVFVKEDLDFMRTTAALLGVANERLVPLVAHDRASLGGMLLANGVALLCTALWGFRAGAGWLWWALLWAGNLAFGAAVGVHFVVGYTSVLHLAPAFAGWALWWCALGLSYRWLMGDRRRGSS
jgi:dihydroorotate dehydrogenase